MASVRITLRRSQSGATTRQKRVLRALGLRRIRQAVVHADTAIIRGMVAKIAHLVDVESGPEAAPRTGGA